MKNYFNNAPAFLNARMETRPIREIWSDIPVGLEPQFEAYIIAKQFQERYKQDVAMGRQPTFPDGFSPEASAKIISQVENFFPTASRLAEEVANVNKKIIDLQVGMGELTREQGKKLNENPYFASLVRQGEIFTNDFELNKHVSDT
jgi:hypothetical protein